jgi:hypothetical protein
MRKAESGRGKIEQEGAEEAESEIVRGMIGRGMELKLASGTLALRSPLKRF